MRVALTGSSSTGKTTLAKKLMRTPEFLAHVDQFLTTNARGLLDAMGCRSMDEMTPAQLQSFQRTYLDNKLSGEAGKDRFLTDRSFVDVAAYWLRRDAVDVAAEQKTALVDRGRQAAQVYDVHVYLPFGLIPFQSDGYRSEDRAHHQDIDSQILALLREWGLPFITLDTDVMEERVARVVRETTRVANSR
jgi:nicotinamide riboside kinase